MVVLRYFVNAEISVCVTLGQLGDLPFHETTGNASVYADLKGHAQEHIIFQINRGTAAYFDSLIA